MEVLQLNVEERTKEYVSLIGQVPLLNDRLKMEEKKLLGANLEEVFYVQYEDVVVQGEEGNTFYIIYDGECEVLINGEVKRTLKKPNFFGERALLNKEPRSATVRVSSTTATLLALDRESFEAILSDTFSG